ncbi:MAG: hypothetical protein R2839_04165 [Thermomicrobiales bacterium]
MNFRSPMIIDFRKRRFVTVVAAVLLLLSGLAQGVSAQPVEPTFNITPGVSEHDAGIAIEGIRLAQDFFVQRLGVDISSPLHVTVLPTADDDAPTRLAVTDEDRITVFTGSEGWNMTSPAERYAVIVHEYTHFYQYLLLREHNFDSPAWFDEGVAEFLSTVAMSEWGLFSSLISTPTGGHSGARPTRGVAEATRELGCVSAIGGCGLSDVLFRGKGAVRKLHRLHTPEHGLHADGRRSVVRYRFHAGFRDHAGRALCARRGADPEHARQRGFSGRHHGL